MRVMSAPRPGVQAPPSPQCVAHTLMSNYHVLDTRTQGRGRCHLVLQGAHGQGKAGAQGQGLWQSPGWAVPSAAWFPAASTTTYFFHGGQRQTLYLSFSSTTIV